MAKQHLKRETLPTKKRREQIILAAFECLKKYGYAQLTARKVAAESGVSLGNITYHFEDMHEIMIEAYRFASRQLLEVTEHQLNTHSQSPETQLRAFLEAGFSDAFLASGYLNVRIELWAAALRSEDLAEVERGFYDSYRAKLRGLIAAVIGPDNAQLDRNVDQVMATLDGLWLDWARRGNREALAYTLDACMTIGANKV